MKQTINTLSLIAALSGLTTVASAQIVVWHDDFDQHPVGANSDAATYGRIAYNFGGSAGAFPKVGISNATPGYPDGRSELYTQ